MTKTKHNTEAENRDEVKIDRERNEVVIGNTAVSVFVEDAGELQIDHTSQMDGYVAFCGEKDDTHVTMHLIDRSDAEVK